MGERSMPVRQLFARLFQIHNILTFGNNSKFVIYDYPPAVAKL